MKKIILPVTFMLICLCGTLCSTTVSSGTAQAKHIDCTTITAQELAKASGAAVASKKTVVAGGRSCSWSGGLENFVSISIVPLTWHTNKERLVHPLTQLGKICKQASIGDNEVISVTTYSCRQTSKIVNYLIGISK